MKKGIGEVGKGGLDQAAGSQSFKLCNDGT